MIAHDGKLTLTVEEAARQTGLGLNKMYELVNAKGFPAITVGRRKLIVKSKFIEWLEDNIGRHF
jgi:excisionase family DNA binding protein